MRIVAKKDKASAPAKTSNGANDGSLAETSPAAAAPANPQLDPEIVNKIAQVRSHVRESFGNEVPGTQY
jgi:hypothetical protein